MERHMSSNKYIIFNKHSICSKSAFFYLFLFFLGGGGNSNNNNKKEAMADFCNKYIVNIKSINTSTLNGHTHTKACNSSSDAM